MAQSLSLKTDSRSFVLEIPSFNVTSKFITVSTEVGLYDYDEYARYIEPD
jgi:hypothetical protein